MNKNYMRYFLHISDMQCVVRILTSELKENGKDAGCCNDIAEKLDNSHQLFHYETTILNYDLPLISRVRCRPLFSINFL